MSAGCSVPTHAVHVVIVSFAHGRIEIAGRPRRTLFFPGFPVTATLFLAAFPCFHLARITPEMVLADLGRRLTAALGELNRSPVVDEALLDATLKSIAAALLEADVNVRLVSQLRNRVKTKVIPQLDGKLDKQSQKSKAVIHKVRGPPCFSPAGGSLTSPGCCPSVPLGSAFRLGRIRRARQSRGYDGVSLGSSVVRLDLSDRSSRSSIGLRFRRMEAQKGPAQCGHVRWSTGKR
jgi:SRP54-type protein, helical bundle domain